MAVNVSKLGSDAPVQAAMFYKLIEEDAEKTRRLAARGKGYTTEEPDRIKAKAERLAADGAGPASIKDMNQLGLERLVGATNDIMSVEYMDMGLLAKHPVGRIEGGAGVGSGFLVGEDLLMTNHHVLREDIDAEDALIIFGDEERRWPPSPEPREYAFRPDQFFFTCKDIDITIVAMDAESNDPPTAAYGYLPLIRKQGKAIRGDALGIIHHPEGGRRSVTLHNGNLLYIENDREFDAFFWHSCDTLPGSSGAPVLNVKWEVVGVHRRGVPYTNKNYELLDKNGRLISKEQFEANPDSVVWIANEAVRASRIVKALEAADDLPDHMIDRRDRVLALWGSRFAARDGLRAAQKGMRTES